MDKTKTVNGKEFQVESNHLDNLTNSLNITIRELDEKRNAIDVNPYSVGVDYDSIEEIQHLKYEKRNLDEKINEYKSYLDEPYIGRFDFSSNGKVESCYIGDKDLVLNNKQVVYSKHSPLGIAYAYSSDPNPQIASEFVKACLRRGFVISKSKLLKAYDNFIRSDYNSLDYLLISDIKENNENNNNSIEDSNNVLYDPYLMNLLEIHNQSKELFSIFSSIQENQLNIVTKDANETFVIQGCAGSGKTAIMFERLQFLKYRGKLNLSKTFVISPNEGFTKYVDYFVKSLELGEIGILTLSEYYNKILKKYNFDFKTIQREDKIDSKFLIKIYSKESKNFLNNWVDYYYKSALFRLENQIHLSIFRKYLSPLTNVKLLDIKNKFEKLNNDLRFIYNNFEAFFNKLYDILNSIYIKYFSLDEYFKNRDIEYYKNELYSIKSKIFDISNNIKNLFYKPGDTKTNWYDYKSYEDIKLESIERIKSVINQFNTSNLTFVQRNRLESIKKELDSLKDPFNLFENLVLAEVFDMDFIDYLKEIDLDELNFNENSINEAKTNVKKAILSISEKLKIDYIINNIYTKFLKKIFGEDNYEELALSKKNYQFSQYIYLILLHRILDTKLSDDHLLAIDEAQEYSPEEFNLIKEINANVTLNIYGDLNQRSSQKGIKSWTNIDGIKETNISYIKENYRNPGNIVKFIDKELGLNDIPCALFIKGEINRISKDDVLSLIIDGNATFIAKDFNPLINYIKEYLDLKDKAKIEELNVFFNSRKIKNNYFLTPIEAKGQEYSDVVVLTKGMDNIDKYISFTRSKNKLYICDEL